MEQTTTGPRPSSVTAPGAEAPTGATTAPSERSSETTFESLAVAAFVFGIFAVVIAVFAVGLAARAVSESSGSGGAAAGGPAPATIDVALADFSLDPASAEISAGGTINLTNEGATQHDLVIEGVKSDMINPGGTGDFTIDGLDPGQYVMYCDIPGHREAGMTGLITVK